MNRIVFIESIIHNKKNMITSIKRKEPDHSSLSD